MAQYAEALDDAAKQAIAELLTGHELEDAELPAAARCDVARRVEGPVSWSGWGGSPEGMGYRTAEAAGMTAADLGRLELAWTFAIPGGTQTRSKPAMVGEHVVVASLFGDVLALRGDSGCIDWQLQVDAAVRGAMTVVERQDGELTAYFADFLTNVYAVDVSEGRLLWKTRVGRHAQHAVTGSVAVHGGRVFVPLSSMEVATALDPRYPCCSSSGGIVALSADDGSEQWYHRVIGDSVEGLAGAPVWSSPTIDDRRGLLYFGTGQHYASRTSGDSDAIRAIDLATGRVAWTFQATEGDSYNVACGPPPGPNCPDTAAADFDFGMAPMLVTRADGRQILVAGQKSGMVYALDPDAEGTVLWSVRAGRGGALGGVHWGMASDGHLAYAPVSDRDVGGLGRHLIVGPPQPGLHAIDLMTGDLVWSAAAPETCGDRVDCFQAFSAAPTAIDGVVFQGGLDGRIRAFSGTNGELLWEFDTVREFEAVGGVTGRGGAMDAAGPVVGGGLLLVNSGYGAFGQMPGNVILAFRVGR
jgi:polyvinyl alcohol dehydrogenase (cytochrome)